jgi:hypothetical protein
VNLLKLFIKPKIIGVCADVNQGKSMFLYHLLETLSKNRTFKLYYYGLRVDFKNSIHVYSVQELEEIKNSFIIIDELSSLFDMDNRKVKRQIESSLRLINHNNNILVVCGTPENFKKFLSAKLDYIMYKKCSLADFINGSRVKNVLLSYCGNERGTEVLNLNINECLIFDGKHYETIYIPYYKKYDTKRNNEKIFKRIEKVKK